MKKYIFLLSLFWAITTSISAQNITRLEYSIDVFVAEGNGIALDVPGSASEVDTEFNIDISDLEPGHHTVYMRAMNEKGIWSFTAERSFYVAEEPITEGIVAIEYIFDQIVQEGEGEIILLDNPSNLIDSTLLTDISGLDPGIHNIYLRAKNKYGVWSLPAVKSFIVAEPDTAEIEYVHYRIYNNDFETDLMTAIIDPARKEFDSTIMISVEGLDLDVDYNIEFYAENNMGVRSFPAYLQNVNLRINNPPQRMKELMEITIPVTQSMDIFMDTLFTDEDLVFGDSLHYSISGYEDPALFDFTEWNSNMLFSLSPLEGDIGTYNFWFKTTDLSGVSDSIQVMLTVSSATGIFDAPSADAFKVYPNPANDFINISRSEQLSANYDLFLLNSTGQILYRGKIAESNHTLDMSKYAGGIYVIVLKSDEVIQRSTIVLK